MHWLKDGNKNSKFFHNIASKRKRRNCFDALLDGNGVKKAWGDGLEEVITEYFDTLFTSAGSNSYEVLACMEKSLTAEQRGLLDAPFTKKDVKDALFSMNPEKARGPDGLNPDFYQKYWNIFEDDVANFCLRTIENGVIPSELGETTIALIPKVDNVRSMNDFGPISLCEVLYKIIAKMLVNRMKPMLSSLVSEFQSAFIPGRLITDNALVAFEIQHYLRLKRTGKTGYVAFKIDMSKAYDRIEWDYLRRMLHRMGFTDRWVNLLMSCVTSVKFWVNSAGGLLGPILPSRGLRQGDPLSPYLFILCAEGLSALIRKKEVEGRIHGCRIARGAPTVSHLFFCG